ncbi:MAG: Myo-inositol 2-dehydrogenase [Anaerolineales bacterium]|nr:Myo-inositol 2-dehydrogenase [Anaerolineales bacterium]
MSASELRFRAAASATADIITEAAEQLAADLEIPLVSSHHRVILEDDRIDAVVVCSSTDTHAQMIEEAAEAGKHIFCEKPIALDLAKIDRALEAVEEAGVKLQVGFNRRFDPSFRRVRELVAQGEIGTPHILRVTSRDPEPPPIEYVKVSGGIFVDMTIHDFDMARYLIGGEVEEVYASGAVLVDERIGEVGDIDTTIITLRFANGVLGSIDNSRQAVYGYDQRVEVFGSEGVAIAGNETPDRVTHIDEAGAQSAKPVYFFIERYTEAYVEEMRAFIDCVREDKEPPVTGLDGRIPVVMGYAAQKSYEENRPVKLSEVE